MQATSTDIPFLTLVNKRLDEVKMRLSHEHYMDTVYHAKRWVSRWPDLLCSEITLERITALRNERSLISNQTANKELRYLRSLFNWAIKNELVDRNPANRVDMLRIEKNERYVPSKEDIEKVVSIATPEQKDYLICLRETLARSREINNLLWEDVNFVDRTVTLYTRKKRHGTKTPRVIPMTERLYQTLSTRFGQYDETKPWVFWHLYFSRKTGQVVCGPYQDRKKFMNTLCEKAGVRYFRFHPLRHAGASLMDSINIPLSEIQGILGHENRKTTEGYIHTTRGRSVEVMRAFEKAQKNKHLNN
jgi:integrase